MLLLFLLQTLQSFLFFIPAFAIQVYAGYLSPILGSFIIYISFIISNIILFIKLPKLEMVTKWFKQNQSIINQYILIFMIPIIPNLVKPYIAKHNHLSLKQFIQYITITNLPLILLSSIIGACIKYTLYRIATLLFTIYSLLFLISCFYLFIKTKR